MKLISLQRDQLVAPGGPDEIPHDDRCPTRVSRAPQRTLSCGVDDHGAGVGLHLHPLHS